jgi:hypothetical protein
MPDSPVISGVADLPKFYFAEGAPFRLSLTIGAEFSMTGKFVTFGMRARSGTVRRVFGTDSGESNLTIAGQVITFNVATTDATVPAFASGWTLEDVQAKGETEYWVDISATEGSDVLLRLQGQADWVPAGSDIAQSSAVVASPSIDVNITSGAVSASVAVLGAAEPTLTTNTATSGLTGILKAASNTLDVAVAGTDYVATNDSRLTDARTPTSHVHGGISNAGAIGSTSGLPIKTGTSGVLEAGAFGTGSGQFAQGNDARFHDRSHAMTSTSDHTAGNWKVFHSNASGQIVELPLGADGTFLKSNGASLAPSFATPAGGGGSSITGTGIAYVRSGGSNTTGTIGNPSLPYLTAQAAWDAGARVFDLGSGSFSFTHADSDSQTLNVFVRGLGKERTSLAITWTGTTGTAGTFPGGIGSVGATPSNLALSSDHSVAISLTISGGTGGVGGLGADGSGDTQAGNGGDGGNGGTAPSFTLYSCYVSALTYTGGIGGEGGQPGTDNGGGAGSVGTAGGPGNLASDAYYWCVLPNGYSANTPGARQACFLNDIFYASIPASEIDYGATTVDAALNSLTSRAVTEHYMRTSDFTTSSTTVADVSGMSCSVAINEKLLIEIVGFQAGGASGDGIKICFSGPASPTHVRYSLIHFTTTAVVRSDAAATAFNTDVVETSGTTVMLPFKVILTLINGSSGGTIQFKAAAEGTGTPSITIPQGLTMRVHRIP